MGSLSDSSKGREIWFDGRYVPLECRSVWELINNSPIQKILVTQEQRQSGHFPVKTQFVVEVASARELVDLSPDQIIFSPEPALLDTAKARGMRTCIFLSIDSYEALEYAWREATKYDFAVVEFDLPTNIPLELILARLQHEHTLILKKEATFAAAEVALGVMEKGSDGILLSTVSIDDISRISRYLAQRIAGSVELSSAVVKRVEHVGMGVRACVDTTGLMSRDEGMLVGSTSTGGILVCSETHYLPYMNLRPFRVNAGAVHSYVWMPGGAAEYLTDLSAGKRVLCVDTQGRTRPLTVGRVKMEVRPLLLIQGESDGQALNVIVQDDWHIRLMGADGMPRNATEIRAGDELLAHLCKPGRHVGIAVDETIIEV